MRPYGEKFIRRSKLEKMGQCVRKANLQKFIKFNWFISEAALLDAILTLNLHHSRYDYLNDDDFERYVFKDITETEALFIADKLNKDFYDTASEWDISVKWPGCTKANLIRSSLKESNGFWKTHPAPMLSHIRRITCSCHETGSFFCTRSKTTTKKENK